MPYSETNTATLTLPLVGFEADDAEFDGFLKTNGEPIVTKSDAIPPVAMPQNDPVNPTVETRKKTDEGWEAYLARLVESHYLSEAEVDHWKAGNPIAISREMPCQKMRIEQRTRMVTEMQTVTEKNRAGEEIQRNKPVLVPQTYNIKVPYTERVEMSIDLPEPGVLQEDAVVDGFLQPYLPDNQVSLEEQLENLKNRTSKTADETWEDYLERLNKDRFITRANIAEWNQGETIQIENSYDLKSIETEEVTYQVTVPYQMKVVDDEGNETFKNMTKVVPKTVSIKKPGQATRVGSFAIPVKGEQEQDATNPGLIFRDDTAAEK